MKRLSEEDQKRVLDLIKDGIKNHQLLAWRYKQRNGKIHYEEVGHLKRILNILTFEYRRQHFPEEDQ